MLDAGFCLMVWRMNVVNFSSVIIMGSVESRERPSNQGKRWPPSTVSQPKDHGKGNSISTGLF